MMQKELTANRPIASVGEEIGYDLGYQMVKEYQLANPTDTRCYTIGKNIIEQILAQPGVEGIRFYNAYNEEGQKTLVYMGVDANGDAIKEYSLIDNNGNIQTRQPIVADRNQRDDDREWWRILIFW